MNRETVLMIICAALVVATGVQHVELVDLRARVAQLETDQTRQTELVKETVDGLGELTKLVGRLVIHAERTEL